MIAIENRGCSSWNLRFKDELRVELVAKRQPGSLAEWQRGKVGAKSGLFCSSCSIVSVHQASDTQTHNQLTTNLYAS